LVTAALVGTRFYLIGMRRSENRWTHASLVRELEEAPRAAAAHEVLNHDLRYDSLVSARSREAAIEIAAEALPAGMDIVHVEATDMAAHEGRDSWQVAIWFSGSFGRPAG